MSLTPSAVTKRVHSLERRTGTTLFERSRHGMQPSPAAQRLYPAARQR